MNSSTSTKLHGEITGRTKTNAETQTLAAITLACYLTTLIGLLAFGHSLFALSLNEAGQKIAAIYSTLAVR